MKKLICTVLTLCVLCGMLIFPASAATYSDISGHWAAAAIERWSERGVLKGSDGKFRPNDTISKAELATILNRLLSYSNDSKMKYNDVQESDWFYNDFIAMSQLGIIQSEKNSAKPNQPLTRDEAVHMFAAAFGVIRNNNVDKIDTDALSDMTSANTDFRADIYNMQMFGFIGGFPDGTFRPTQTISRAEVVTVLDNMISVWIHKPGSYSAADGNILISCGNVEIKNQTADYIFISPGVICEPVHISTDKSVPSRVFMVGWSDNTLTFSAETPQGYFSLLADSRARETIIKRFADGTGTENDPAIIKTPEQLKLISEFCFDMLKYHFKLGNDITLTDGWSDIGKSYKNGFTLANITSTSKFFGSLDGAGNTIRILNEVETTSSIGGGLFKCIGGGRVSNLKLEGELKFTAYGTGIYSNYKGGALANYVDSQGKIDNCHVKLKITGDAVNEIDLGGITGVLYSGEITNCTADTTIEANAAIVYIGGIAGTAEYNSVISDCTAKVNLVSTGTVANRSGGIAGSVAQKSSIDRCDASGSIQAHVSGNSENAVAGGVVGVLSNASLDASSSTADVSASGGYYSMAGGLVGAVTKPLNFSGVGSSVSNSYATGNVTATDAEWQNNAGGITGQVYYGSVATSWSSGNVTAVGDPGYFNAAGGFAGSCYEDGVIEDCYSTGSVTVPDDFIESSGGFTGRLAGVMKNCYTTSKVITENGYTDFVMVGSISSVPDVNNCFDLMSGSPLSVNIDLVEPISKGDALNKSTYSNAGWDFNTIWSMSDTGYRLPTLRGVGDELQKAFATPGYLG